MTGFAEQQQYAAALAARSDEFTRLDAWRDRALKAEQLLRQIDDNRVQQRGPEGNLEEYAPRLATVRKFATVVGQPHAVIAGQLAEEIKAAIFKYEGRIPLALAIGVLRIVEKELLDGA